ncbi:MAG TPA: hypothetical protein VD741_04875 [Solirubrobacterales bacterium]|nr:hypothetical protein [Solirubrobacterales bacterium]
MQLRIVRALNQACVWVDEVAYRPAVVKLTRPLPRWWSCQLARASMKLDDRWGTGYWDSDEAPAVPGGPCDACGRRAAWLVYGGSYDGVEDEEPGELDDGDYLDRHEVQLCGWCRLEFSSPPESKEELDRLLALSRERSVSWRWR